MRFLADRLVRACVVCLVGCLIVFASAASGAAGPMENIHTLSETLRSQPAWQADYHQVFVPAGMTIGEEADGVVWVAFPDRALFRTGDPAVRWMGLRERRVRLIDLEVPSCDDHELTDDEWASIPLSVVIDARSAIDSFTVLDHGEHGFALVPREKSGIARVDVELNDDSLPSLIRVVDPQGGSNTMMFTRWKASQGAPDGAWIPKAPEGLECVKDLE